MKVLDPIWKHFDRDASNHRNIKATCRTCGLQLQGVKKRLEKHVESCQKIIKEHADNTNDSAESKNEVHNIQDEMTSGDKNDTPNPPKRLKTGTLDDVVVSTKRTENDEINLQMTRFILASNSAFSVANNTEFHKFCKMLRPGVKVADRRDVGGDLLDVVYGEEMQKAKYKCAGNIYTYLRLIIVSFMSVWSLLVYV